MERILWKLILFHFILLLFIQLIYRFTDWDDYLTRLSLYEGIFKEIKQEEVPVHLLK